MSHEQTEMLSKAVKKIFILLLMFYGGNSFKESVFSTVTVTVEDNPKGSKKVEELVRGREIRSVNLSAQLVPQQLTLWSLLESCPGTFQLN